MRNIDVFVIFLAVRLASVFLVQTYFVPDEYWQSLEVAHKIVYDYGYLTWEWTYGIRSYVYPLIFAAFYKILQLLNLDSPLALIYGPRVLQALLSSYADLCFYQWSGTRKWAVFIIASSWFWFYTASRTLINTFECALSTIALSMFPWPGKASGEKFGFLFLLAFICFVRLTAAIVWIPLCIYHLFITRHSIPFLIFTKYIPIGILTIIPLILLDSWAYGQFIITPYEFLKFNVFKDIGSFYGSHPWHWYLSSGFPAIVGIQFLPFFWASVIVVKNRQIHQNELVLLATIVFTITVYSFLPHKEFRFLLPILPIVLYISSRFLSAWSRKAKTLTLWLVAGIIFMGNAVPAFYLGTVHQSGTIEIMESLREIASKNPENTQFLFLMPCHSTPLYSHLHVNVSIRFLTCEPNFNSSNTNYMDEADRFYINPIYWLRQHYPPNGTLPSHIITFDSLSVLIQDILTRYKEVYSVFHTSLPSERVGRFVVLYELIP